MIEVIAVVAVFAIGVVGALLLLALSQSGSRAPHQAGAQHQPPRMSPSERRGAKPSDF